MSGEALEFVKQDGVKPLLSTLRDKLASTEDLDANTIKTLIKESGKATGMKGKMLFMPTRIAVSGTMHGPDLPQMMNLLGKAKLLARLDETLSKL